MYIRFLILFLFLFIFLSTANALEKILSLNVDIYIKRDSSLKIVEKIKVNSEGRKIKRGIYRDFPTKYRRSDGSYYNTGFELKSVKRDGTEENYRIERQSNGVRVYLGKKDRYLSPGIYKYKIVFKTDRQIGYFKDHDELYFNAIGAGWDFPIEKSEVRVFLPKNVNSSLIKHKAYTGEVGSLGSDYQSGFNSSNEVFYYLTKPLKPRQAFTVFLAFPKGIVKELNKREKRWLWFKDNFFLVFALISSFFGFLIHFLFWKNYGKDPEGRTIYPLFEAPENIEPYSIPYVKHMREHRRSLPSLIASLAVKGHLKIKETEGSFFSSSKIFLEKLETEKDNLSSLETLIFKQLFLEDKIIECKPQNYKKFEVVKKYLKSFLTTNYSKYFNLNFTKLIPGFLFQFAAFLILLILGYEYLLVPIVLINSLIFVFFFIYMKSYTKEGRSLMDKIEGYQEFLSTAEKGRFDKVQAIDFTEKYFEKHLPYAIAFGCESKWLKAFENALANLGKDISTYNPTYFSGPNSFSQSKAFSEDNFSNSISQASVPPGSSSGSGGSSGGGGGGGGGGGW